MKINKLASSLSNDRPRKLSFADTAQSTIAQDSWSDEQWDDGWDTEQNQSINVYGDVEAAIGG